jgi:cytochrome b
VVGIVVCVRLIWGFLGTGHARFADFVRSPTVVFRYVRDIISNRAQRFVGHNPAGGAMILALLILLAGTVFSGLMLYAIEENAGPLATWVADRPGESKDSSSMSAIDLDDDDRMSAHEDGKSGDAREEFWEETHEILTNLTLLLIGFHITGVLLGSYTHKENLIKAMFTGRKRPNGE